MLPIDPATGRIAMVEAAQAVEPSGYSNGIKIDALGRAIVDTAAPVAVHLAGLPRTLDGALAVSLTP